MPGSIPGGPTKLLTMEEIKDTCYKGTRIVLGTEKRLLIHDMVGMLVHRGFEEIHMPSLIVVKENYV